MSTRWRKTSDKTSDEGMKIKARDEAFNCYWRWQQELEGRWARILETRVVYCCLVYCCLVPSRRPYIRSRTQGLIQADLKEPWAMKMKMEMEIEMSDEWWVPWKGKEEDEYEGICWKGPAQKPGGVRSRTYRPIISCCIRSRTHGPIISYCTASGRRRRSWHLTATEIKSEPIAQIHK